MLNALMSATTISFKFALHLKLIDRSIQLLSHAEKQMFGITLIFKGISALEQNFEKWGIEVWRLLVPSLKHSEAYSRNPLKLTTIVSFKKYLP